MANISILQLVMGPIETNCYIIGDQDTKKCAVIDPAGRAKDVLNYVEKEGWAVDTIINTHGHWDHIAGNNQLQELTKAQLMIHEEDASYLTDPNLSDARVFGGDGNGGKATRLLKDGDTIEVGNIQFKVIHTPGHTKGGISLFLEDNKILFCGDTLFQRSIGRTDFYGGNFSQIIESIKTKILPLGDDVMAYPGHGPETNLGDERIHNPFLRPDSPY